jgi:hypothetical protein
LTTLVGNWASAVFQVPSKQMMMFFMARFLGVADLRYLSHMATFQRWAR